MHLLIPDIESMNALPAVRYAVRAFLDGERCCVHLLYVREAIDPAAADRALAPARALLERFHVPCTVHVEEAQDPVRAIRMVAHRVGAGRIVLCTARRWSLTRFAQDALIRRLLDTAPVPVSVVAGRSVTPLERCAVAGLGTTLALMFAG